MKKFLPIIFIVIITAIFFRPFIFQSKLPIPSDTIVGLYHPFRDLYAEDYPRGIPFKNFLITDPVRQQYPWRELTIDLMKKGQIPLWNPYSFSGTPLLANLQSAVFYPLNLLFFLFPFDFTWGILIFFEPLLAGIFLYLYLRNLTLGKFASLFGALSFSFSGFFIAWLEWGTILHSALWLPLILLSIDKIFYYFPTAKISNFKFLPRRQAGQSSKLIWPAIFIFSLASSFFAGHLQTFFYAALLSVVYVLGRWWQYGKNIKVILLFTICYLLFAILTAVQWWSTLQFINLSGRELDQINWQQDGWFIPWQNLIQFLAPDFFGNPATLNYWGIWNYGEFVGYIGILPLILVLYALIWRQDKKTLFFGSIFFLSLLFSLPTPLAKFPYQLQIPLLATSQPTRLLFLTDFSLAILTAIGMDFILKKHLGGKQLGSILLSVLFVFVGFWAFVVFAPKFLSGGEWVSNLAVSKRNLILPTILFFVSATLLSGFLTKRIPRSLILLGIFLIVVFDLLRFGEKFTPFTKSEWLFPQTKTIEFLQKQEKPFRIMSTNRQIFQPNFSVIYRLESIEGYDPLYLERYGELIAASERNKPDISPPFGFNRIITPQNFESQITDLLNVKYVLSLDELNSKKLKKVFQEGRTIIYENLKVLPRAFFVEEIKVTKNKKETIELMFAQDFDPAKTAVVEEFLGVIANPPPKCTGCKVKFLDYRENKITIETENTDEGFLVLTDSFYPSWHVKIDGVEEKIYRTDYHFRGTVVPSGRHKIEFYNS